MLKSSTRTVLMTCVSFALLLPLHAEDKVITLFDSALDLLKQAEISTAKSPKEFLKEAYKKLKAVPGSEFKGHKGLAIDDVVAALDAVNKGESTDKIFAYIDTAISEIKRSEEVYNEVSNPTPQATDTKQPEAPTPSPGPGATSAVVSLLTADQARAVVVIKGDNTEGTGFLVKMPDGPVVVTNLHVLANNPNIKITTNSGEQIAVLSAKGAADRDLALLSIKDAKYGYLELASDLATMAKPGDAVITPGNSEGGEVVLNTTGKLLGIGPDRIEFDNPIYHGNSGGPVFDNQSGKVVGVVTEAMKVDLSDDLDKASYSNRASAIRQTMRYFGLRLDNVPSWVQIDWKRFQDETALLDAFENRSEALDVFLNVTENTPKTNDSLDPNLWRSDDRIVKANDTFMGQYSPTAAESDKLDAVRQLLSDLVYVASIDVSKIEDTQNLYSFDQEKAKEEDDYRTALKKELDHVDLNNLEAAIEQMGQHTTTTTPSKKKKK